MSPEEDTPQDPETNKKPATIINLSGYRFVSLEHVPVLQADLERELGATGVLGTILLADEGINVAIAGPRTAINAARECLNRYPALAGLWLKESLSDTLPFSKLKIRVRREIIAFDGGELTIDPDSGIAPTVAPTTLRAELDGPSPPVLLDTRNDYEIAAGGFTQALSLGIDNFRDFRAAVDAALDDQRLSLETPLVTFCTGGIRCEKAAPWLVERGFKDVRQIEGGILNWLASQDGAHWQGDCFVFDDRVTVDSALVPTGSARCPRCHRAVGTGECCSCGA